MLKLNISLFLICQINYLISSKGDSSTYEDYDAPRNLRALALYIRPLIARKPGDVKPYGLTEESRSNVSDITFHVTFRF